MLNEMKRTFIFCNMLIIGVLSPVLLISQSNKEKPYSLEKDRENVMKQWKLESIKHPSDSLINLVINTLRNGNEDEILNCFQHYIYHLNNRKVFEILDSLYLNTSSERIMKKICSTLRFHNYTEAIPNLLKGLEYESTQIKYNAACTLAALGEIQYCLQTFKAIWDDVNWQDKQGINRGLRNIGTPEAISILIKNTKDENTYVGCGAAICLAQIGYYNEAFPVLKEMLLIDDRKVSAINGLAYIGDKKSLDLIKSMIYDKNSHVRSQSSRVLKAYGSF